MSNPTRLTSSSEAPLVLVVEDDPSIRTLLAVSLEKERFRVIACADGKEALETFGTTRPQVVVTDYILPEINGEDLIDQLKLQDPNLPIVMVTGAAPDLTILNLLRYRRFVAVHKPFEIDVLVRAIQHVFSIPPSLDGPEKRKSFRMDTQIRGVLDRYGEILVKNLSLHGLFMETQFALPVGIRVQISLKLLTRIDLMGEVMWVKGNGVGVRFISLSPDADSAVRKFMITELTQKKIGFFK